MQIAAKKIRLPNFPKISKLAFGVVLLVFLLDYQPDLGLPPLKRSTVKAQTIEQTQHVEAKSVSFFAQLPHPGYVSTRFSFFHPGVDIATGLGMPVHPITAGTVVDNSFNFWGLGLVVTIDHGNGYQSLYAHLGEIYVKKGDSVDTNSILGIVGLTGNTTGPHTHLQVSRDGKNFDPLTILPSIGDVPKPEYITPIANNSSAKQPSLTQTFDIKPVTNSTVEPSPTPESKEEKAAKELNQATSVIQPALPLAAQPGSNLLHIVPSLY